jgi:Sec-independent protein translocase protein TatA
LDTICGIGLPELIILALVGFVVVGPDRSRQLALSLGRFLRTVLKSPWWKEFRQVSTALRDLPTTLVRMAELEDELKTVRTDLNRATRIDFNRTMGVPENGEGMPGPDPNHDPWGVGTQPPPSPPSPSQPGEPPAPDDEQSHDN